MEAWLEREFIESGRLPLFLCFFAFVLTFLTTRAITRMIRSGRGPFGDNVSASGLHIHHAVPGVIILVFGAFLAVGAAGATGWAELAGVLVGIGTSLVLDEFALILRLDDVYWAEEGRISVEMVGLTVALLGLILIGFNPFAVDFERDSSEVGGAILGIAIVLMLVTITALKGKYRLALFALLIPPIGIFGSIRLARPDSRWAKRRYDIEKCQRATDRANKFDARYGPLATSVGNFVAGATAESTGDATEAQLD
ncbi:MAG: hypothetical protein DRJ50_02560 [Actinobacteria bacterium]|nr:MAG: hypothetical protein DRJ50_02560 [Actinomycetota bacterium]